jgi:hypothetical protein
MASEYTHVVEAKGQGGDWKPMTKHAGVGAAKQALSEIRENPKANMSNYRVSPYKAPSTAKAAPRATAKAGIKAAAAKPTAKPAAKPTAKAKPFVKTAAKPAAKKR